MCFLFHLIPKEPLTGPLKSGAEQLEKRRALFAVSLAWFPTLLWKVSITFKWAGKQALSRVTGAPSLSTNMWKYVFRSKISGPPSGPCQSSVFFGTNTQTNTCTKEPTLPDKYCTLAAVRLKCTVRRHRYGRGLPQVCAYMRTQHFPPAGQLLKLQWNTY